MAGPFELRLPLTPEQEAIQSDLERELRLAGALMFRFGDHGVGNMDGRRVAKIIRRETDASAVRVAALQARLMEMEQLKRAG